MKNKKIKQFNMQYIDFTKKLLKKPKSLFNLFTFFVKSASFSLLMFLSSFKTVFAAPSEIQPISNSIDNVATILQGFAFPICALAFVVAGLAMMGGQQGRQWAKNTMLFGAIGYLIVAFAPTIVGVIAASAPKL